MNMHSASAMWTRLWRSFVRVADQGRLGEGRAGWARISFGDVLPAPAGNAACSGAGAGARATRPWRDDTARRADPHRPRPDRQEHHRARLGGCRGRGDAQPRAQVDLPAEQVGYRAGEDLSACADDQAAPQVMVAIRQDATSPASW
jgi:hypothetical protein